MSGGGALGIRTGDVGPGPFKRGCLVVLDEESQCKDKRVYKLTLGTDEDVLPSFPSLPLDDSTKLLFKLWR